MRGLALMVAATVEGWRVVIAAANQVATAGGCGLPEADEIIVNHHVPSIPRLSQCSTSTLDYLSELLRFISQFWDHRHQRPLCSGGSCPHGMRSRCEPISALWRIMTVLLRSLSPLRTSIHRLLSTPRAKLAGPSLNVEACHRSMAPGFMSQPGTAMPSFRQPQFTPRKRRTRAFGLTIFYSLSIVLDIR